MMKAVHCELLTVITLGQRGTDNINSIHNSYCDHILQLTLYC
jgi:hypothetical protein